MSKHKRKRFLSILVTAVLVFTLALSSVMAQDDGHVRTDKLSVEGESVEVIEGVASEDDVEIVEDEAITADDAEAEEADADETAVETEEELPVGEVTEEADADVPDAAEDDVEADAGIMTLSAGDIENDENGIMPLETKEVSGSLQDAIDAADNGDTLKLTAEIDENITIAEGKNITLDLNGQTLKAETASSPVITVEGTLTLEDSGGDGTVTGGSGGSIGGVDVTGTFVMNGGSISGNSGTHGGVRVANGGKFTLNNGSISNNSTSSGSGAGVFVNSYNGNDTSFIMNGGTISDNTASNFGGGVNVTVNGDNHSGGGNSTFTMTGGTISGNTASTRRGGGVFVESNSSGSSTFTMKDGTISGNSTNASGDYAHGGGVCIQDATFNMEGGTIGGTDESSKNTAGNGAGVSLFSTDSSNSLKGVFNMSGGTISGNTASSIGGGVELVGFYNEFNMESGTISGNTATDGGGVALHSGDFTMTGGTISENTATSVAGGVYVYYYSSSGTITYSSFVMSGSAKISENTAGSNGGGVNVVANNSFTMNDGEISENTANSGGGVYVNTNGSFTMNGGTLNANETTGNGGGVYTNGAFTLAGGSITQNEGAYGGGVDVHTVSATDIASCTVLGGSVTDNVANKDTVGDGVSNIYLASSSYGKTYITLGASLSGKSQIGVKIELGEDPPTESTPVRFTMIEEGTTYYATSASYFSSDAGYGVRSSSDGAYLELYLLTAETFEEDYLTGDDGNLYTSATADNYQQILDGASNWEALDPDEQAKINEDLTAAWQAAGNTGELTYEDLLAQAQAYAAAADFIYSYVSDSDADNPYLEATADNYEQILSGESDWDAMSEAEQAAVNAILTEAWQAAGNDGELTYPMLLAQAKAMGFEDSYLTGSDGELYTEANADNYEQILAGESDWEALSDEAKEQINADLTAAWQAAGNDGELTYPMLLEQAKAIADANAFEETYLTGSDGELYTEANADNYEQILAGESDWDALSDEAKEQINADLTAAWQAAGNDGELTYPMLLEQAKAIADANAFEEAYLTGSDGELYTAATADNYEQILAGASDWADMSDEAKAQVNADLTAAWQAAGNEGELTYDDLLAQAFQLAYLTDDSGNGPYTEATLDNMDQILAGADDWALMSDEAKAAVNAALQEASGDDSLTYDELLARAFMLKYLSDEDGNLYTEVTADNYEQIMSGEADWYRLSPEAQALVNLYLTAAWQDAGNEGELTYPMLLEEAKAFAASPEGTGNVKTGDSTRLYLYVILAAAAAAAATGAAVSRKRRV